MTTAEANPFTRYLRPDFGFADFRPQARVLDVGCGSGRHLVALRDAGCRPFGVEPDRASAESCRRQGLEVIDGTAEALPVADGAADGVVCCVVLPYADERRAVAEWGRVLAPGGEARVSFICVGYAVRFLVRGRTMRERVYGLRTVLNTWGYAVSGRRLPGFFGDTLYQSERRLRRYYRAAGLELVAAVRGRTFLGLPVLVYHHVRKTGP